MKVSYLACAIACAALGAQLSVRAEVRLAHHFGSNMVLQQGRSAKVWGWAKPLCSLYDEQNQPVTSFSFPVEVK